MADIVYPGEATSGTLNSGVMPANVNLVVYKGDYIELFADMKNADGTVKVLNNNTPKAQLKTNFNDSTPFDFACSLTGTPGQVRIFLSSSISSSLVPGDYIWDFQVTDTAGNTRTYVAGDVKVYPEVTT